MQLSEEELNTLLNRFSGYVLPQQKRSLAKQFFLNFFTQQTILDRFIEAFKESLCEVPENQKITHYFRPK